MAHSATGRMGAWTMNCANASATATLTTSEDAATVSTSGAAHTQDQSLAPRRQRSQWNNPYYSRLTFDFCSTSIQTILLMIFLPVFRDGPAHAALQFWVIGTGIGCLINRLDGQLRGLQSHLLRQVLLIVSNESQTSWHRRFGIPILICLWRSLDIFLELWFGVGIGVVFIRWTTGQALHLNWLSTIFLAIPRFFFTPLMMVYIYDTYMKWLMSDEEQRRR